MICQLYVGFCLALVTAAIPLRAADEPHAGMGSIQAVVWTNDDLANLRDPGLICIVGQISEVTPKASTPTQPFVKTQDPDWYAEQAARLRDELERRKGQLDEYRQSIEEATSLKTAAGGTNLDEGDIGITPQTGIEILQQRLSEAQSQLDALEDMARRNGIEPGTLRGR
jgi:hypothetical protein